jgi:hypothetical protein
MRTFTYTEQRTLDCSPLRLVQLDWTFLEGPRHLRSATPVTRCLPLPSLPSNDGGYYVCGRVHNLARSVPDVSSPTA